MPARRPPATRLRSTSLPTKRPTDSVWRSFLGQTGGGLWAVPLFECREEGPARVKKARQNKRLEPRLVALESPRDPPAKRISGVPRECGRSALGAASAALLRRRGIVGPID